MTAADNTGPAAGLIRREIQTRGVISFARFMELALYAPEVGYYERAPARLGRGGDFYTSVSVGSLFGELLAWQFALWAEEAGAMNADARSPRSKPGGRPPAGPRLQIVEAGAHDGRLAADLLGALRRQRPKLFETLRYWIIEPSARRRRWQQETLVEFGARVHWAASPAAVTETGYRIVFCNELLDALPVHRLGWDAAARGWIEWGVGWERGRFVWKPMPPDTESSLALPPPDLAATLPDGYTLELCPAAVRWWTEAAAALRRGKLVAIDYGLSVEDRFAPHRLRGTLRAYRHHRVSHDVLAAPGDQDLTAHVDFTALQAAGEAAGLRTEELVSQHRFLTRLAARAGAAPETFGAWTPERTRQFHTLTHPDHLGHAFKVLVQARSAPAEG